MKRQRFNFKKWLKEAKKRGTALAVCLAMLMGSGLDTAAIYAVDGREAETEAADDFAVPDQEPQVYEGEPDVPEEESASIEETLPEEVVFEIYDKGIDLSITIMGDTDSLDGVSDAAATVLDDMSAWQKAVDGIDDGSEREVIAVYDISLLDGDGNGVEPDDSVLVSFAGGAIAEAAAGNRHIEVYHLPDGAGRLKAANIDNVYAKTHGSDTVMFTADGFSEYAVVLRTDGDTQAETDLGDGNEWFETDKYLTVDAQSGYVNGQPKAVITIEQAFHTNGRVNLEKLPARSDVILEIGANSNMSGNAQYQNEYILNFLYRVMVINQEREMKAKNNEYAGLTYDGDDEQFEKDMENHWIYVDGCLKYNNKVYIENEDRLLIRTWADVCSLIKNECGYDNRDDANRMVGCGHVHYYFEWSDKVNPFYSDIPDPSQWKVPAEGGSDWNLNYDYTRPAYECVWSGKLACQNEWSPIASGSALTAMSRADLASRQARDWTNELYTYYEDNDIDGNVSVILLTDTAPYGYGPSGTFRYNEERDVFGANANDALQYAREMKEKGATIYVGYACIENKDDMIGRLSTMDKNGTFRLSTGDLRHGKSFEKEWDHGDNDDGQGDMSYSRINDDMCDVMFMSAYSSDFKRSGVFEVMPESETSAGYGDWQPYSITMDTINPGIKLKVGHAGEFEIKGSSLSTYASMNGSNFAAPYTIKDADGNIEEYNTFGEYMFSTSTNNGAENNINEIAAMCARINEQAAADANKGNTGYAGPKSYIYDEITDPFKVTNVHDIKVYMVPRIPKDIDASTGIPAGLDIQGGCGKDVEDMQVLGDDAFKWGEKLIKGKDLGGGVYTDDTTEWIDITNRVNIDPLALKKNIVKISGFDYEHAFSVHNYDIDYVKMTAITGGTGEEPGTEEPGTEEPGTEEEPKTGVELETKEPETGESGESESGTDEESGESGESESGTNEESGESESGTDEESGESGESESGTDEESGESESGTDEESGESGESESGTDEESGESGELGTDPTEPTDPDDGDDVEINTEGFIYKTGDYGYKIVVEIPIVSKTSFGGNNIKTNNTDTSGFYPAMPTDGRDAWDDDYIALYPECKMNLRCNYNIVTDDAVIYAPETKKVHDLLTNADNYLWYTDEHFFTNQSALTQALDMLDSLKAQRAGEEKKYQGYTNPNSDEAKASAALIHTFDKQIGDWSAKADKLREEFASYVTYVPDGRNNAFVDITYTAKLPSGEVFATMTIQHGKAFWFEEDEEGNGIPSIEWDITGGADAMVQESGTYVVSAVITPVATTKSPSWHVYTEADRNKSGYESRSYSSTGSDGVGAAANNTYNDMGPQAAATVTAKAKAYIYVLEITANDGQREPGARVDVNFGTQSADGSLRAFAIRSGTTTPVRGADGMYDCQGNGMTYIEGFRWICTDGVTPSIKENEPTWMGKSDMTGVAVKTTIPDAVIGDDKVIKESNGLLGINIYDGIDGEYVPVQTVLTRDYKSINKGENGNTWLGAVTMTDTDGRYGSYSCVRWMHKCESGGMPISDTCGYDDGEFNFAVSKYGADVHYLIHVVINVPPAITKEVTESSVISTTDTFKWTITASNTDDNVNKRHRTSSYTLLDILPHANDKRGGTTQYGWLLDNTELGTNGSYINGVLRYKSVKVDFSKAPSAKAYFQSYKGMSFTTSSAVYNDLNPDDVYRGTSGVTWTAAGGYSFNGDILSFSGFDAGAIYAFRLESILAFGESISVYIEADTEKSSDKKENNIAINEAFIATGNGFVKSVEVPIEVVGMSISGSIWIDTDGSNTMTPGEPRVGGVTIGLYRKKEPGDKQASATAKSYTLPDGSTLQLAKAFNIENNAISNTLTSDDGGYVFQSLNAGTYYIVADTLPLGYNVVKKQAGGARHISILDSEAEEFILDNGSDKYLNNTAIVKEVQVGLDPAGNDTIVKGINVGLTEARGAIYVGKTAEQIKIPSTFTDEQRADFKAPVIFYIRNVDTGIVYAQTVLLTEENCKSFAGEPQVYAAFEDVPLGTYEVWESEITKNEITSIGTTDSNVTPGTDKATVVLDYDNVTAKLWFANKFVDHDTFSYNGVAMHVPVKLELKYTGSDPVGMKNNDLYYIFKDSDFEDYIVTYDDGTTISKKAGTLAFEDLVLTPGSMDDPITRFMNTTGNEKIVITGFYMERGIVVTDSFRVGVTLKPLYKFTVRFKNNYSAGEGGTGFSNVGFSENIVTYLYDEVAKKVEVTSGLYMDQANGGLAKPWYYYDHSKYFDQYGWNTEYDGSGQVMPIDLSSVNISSVLISIGEYMRGENPTHTVYSDMTWWAEWRGTATFVAGYNNNDGHIETSSGCTALTQEIKTFSKNGKIFYNEKGHIDNAAQISYFDHWNRASSSSNPAENAAGNDLELGVTRFNGGEVFYAIYYIAEFKYTGKSAVFTAPIDGSYTFELWGSPGGNRYSHNAADGTGIGGNGGYVQTTMTLSRNQQIYAFVGSAGAASRGDACMGGYNGGGPSLVCMVGPHSASGGGATHISTVNNPIIADLFVKLLGDADPNDTDTDDDDDNDDETEGDGSSDPTEDAYTYETTILHYGGTLKGATQAELINFVRNKLMSSGSPYKNYINSSTAITEVGLYRSYSGGKRKGGTNNAKIAWFLIECHTWNDKDKTIAIAGGGSGGSAIKNLNGMTYGWAGGDTANRGYGGNNVNNKRTTFNANMKMADNETGIGYAQGAGMFNSNSSGGGGGWWGGYSSSCYGSIRYQKKGGRCGDICGGGTSYVNTDNAAVTIEGDPLVMSGNDTRLRPGGTHQKPTAYDIGINGYIRVTKVSP